MKIYIVIWEDRHVDTEVYPYLSRGAALAFAADSIQQMRERYGYSHEGEPEELSASMIQGGWIFYRQYSCDGCNIRVVEKELDV